MTYVGQLLCTPEGLEALAKSLRILGGKTGNFKVYVNDEKSVRICCEQDAGWIDLCKGWPV